MKRNKAGFTLVELMVVAIIVAILAAVAIPLMSANKKRAMATEAEAALGTARTALRAMYAETKAYNLTANNTSLDAGDALTSIPGLSSNDLNGRYFGDADYDIQAIGPSTYTLRARGNQAGSAAPKKADVDGITIRLTEAGDFTRTGL